MVKAKTNKIIYVVLGVLLVLALFGINSQFSVIGNFQKPVECVFNESDGGVCLVEFTLPKYRTVENFHLTMTFDKFPHPDEFDRQQVTPFASGGDYIDEDNKHLATSQQTLTHNYLYFYRLPSSWNIDDVDIVRIESYSQGNSLLNTHTSARSEMVLFAGYVKIPYPFNTINVCTQERWRNCNQATTLVQAYTDSYDRARRFYFPHGIYNDRGVINTLELELLERMRVGETNIPITGDLRVLTEISFKESQYYRFFTNKEDFVFFVHATTFKQWRGFVTHTMNVPPITFMSYKKLMYPTNVDYGIEGYSNVHTLQGVLTNQTRSNDLANDIQLYCQRQNFDDTCTFTLKFESETPGIMKIISEEAIMGVVYSGTKETPKGEISQGVEERDILDTLLIVIGIVLAILLIIFFVVRGIRKNG